MHCFAADPGEVLTDITRMLPGPVYAMYRRLLPRILLTPAQGGCFCFRAGSPANLSSQSFSYEVVCSSHHRYVWGTSLGHQPCDAQSPFVSCKRQSRAFRVPSSCAAHPERIAILSWLCGPWPGQCTANVTDLLIPSLTGARSSLHCAGSVDVLQQHAAGGCYFSSGCLPVPSAAEAADGTLVEWLWHWAVETVRLSDAELAAVLPQQPAVKHKTPRQN